MAPSPRSPGLAHSARSGRPFPAGGCPTHVPNFAGRRPQPWLSRSELKRLGKIREPYYRIVVADSRTKRDGRAIEEIGKYHPKLEPSLIEVDSERVQYWLSVGAQPTDPVRHLLTITGDWQKFKGLPGTEGTLKTAEPKADKKDRYDELVKEVPRGEGDQGRRQAGQVRAEEGRSRRRRLLPRSRPTPPRPTPAKADAPKADAPKADAVEAEAPQATATVEAVDGGTEA